MPAVSGQYQSGAVLVPSGGAGGHAKRPPGLAGLRDKSALQPCMQDHEAMHRKLPHHWMCLDNKNTEGALAHQNQRAPYDEPFPCVVGKPAACPKGVLVHQGCFIGGAC
jgi:hypothetical protein